MFFFELVELEKDLVSLIREINDAISVMLKAQSAGVGDYTKELDKAYLDHEKAVNQLNEVHRKMKAFFKEE